MERRSRSLGLSAVLPAGRRPHHLHRDPLRQTLHDIPDGALVEIDGSHALYIDRDVLEIIAEFRETAHHRGIEVKITEVPLPTPRPPRKPVVEEDDEQGNGRRRPRL